VLVNDAQLDQLSKHPAERRLSRRHIAKFAPAQCNYRVFPQFYIRATKAALDESDFGTCSRPRPWWHPGQDIEYVVVDDKNSSRERVALTHEETGQYDPLYYETELVRVVESIISPLVGIGRIFGSSWQINERRRSPRSDHTATTRYE